MTHLSALKQKTHELNVAIYALFVALKDNRVKWYTKLLPAFVIGYALSPIDIIPDLLAVFGFLDDVVVVALGCSLGYNLLGRDVRNEARLHAYQQLGNEGEQTDAAYSIVGFVWMLALTLFAIFCYKFLFVQVL